VNNTFQKHKNEILRKRMQAEMKNAQKERIDLLVNIAIQLDMDKTLSELKEFYHQLRK
jgi:hypothetical protein